MLPALQHLEQRGRAAWWLMPMFFWGGGMSLQGPGVLGGGSWRFARAGPRLPVASQFTRLA